MRRILVIGFGNPGRWDDGLGPALAAWLEGRGLPGVTVESDYQLTVEDAEAVARHEVVMFVDAAVEGSEPFYFRRIRAHGSPGFSSHSVEPGEVLALAGALFDAHPEAYVLGIRGYVFDAFGEGLSPRAGENLAAAARFVERVLREDQWAALECGEGGKNRVQGLGVQAEQCMDGEYARSRTLKPEPSAVSVCASRGSAVKTNR